MPVGEPCSALFSDGRKGVLKCFLAAATAALTITTTAHAYPPKAPKHWTPPAWWAAQAACIRSHEGWATANTGNGYYGAYQFLLSTWQSVGGPSYPHLVSLREQAYRAWLLYLRSGRSWSQWGTAGKCGLR